jgi:tagatose-1,6-bisphosphate aldolase non-catalytic subunit AgaZ/GatZ
MTREKTELIVTAVHYDEDEQHIAYVFVGIPPVPGMNNHTVDGMRLYTRDRLIEALRNGQQFFIAAKSGDQWFVDHRLRIVTIQNQPYLRVDDFAIPVDDLGNLARIRSSR